MVGKEGAIRDGFEGCQYSQNCSSRSIGLPDNPNAQEATK